MSQLPFNVLNLPTRPIVFKLFRRDLYVPDDPLHKRAMSLYESEYDFFNTVCRLAMALAEENIFLTPEVHQRLRWTVDTIAGYFEDRIGYIDGGPETEWTMTVKLNRQHLFAVARNIATYMPSGVWTDLKCKVLNIDYVVLIGTLHETDYR